MKNDTLLRALRRQPTPYTPVWLMRQAGRYLPEYRRLRAEAGDFMNLCRNPELACEATMQPLRRFPLDAAILFSDILTIPDALGLGLYFSAGEGPRFERPLKTVADIDALAAPAVDDSLRYVVDAVARIRRELADTVPLIGFAGSPWTLATYMVEGRSTRSFALSKRLLWDQPAAAHRLLALLAAAVTDYLNAQIAAGAQAVMVFDTWGGVLTPGQYREFSLAYMARIVAGLDRGEGDDRVPAILFTKGAGGRLEDMAASGCDALGVDWTVDLAEARRLTGDRVALQGNLDPAALYASPEAIRSAVGATLASYGEGPGHVFNLGHGLAPDMDPERVGALVAAVHELSRGRSPAPAR